MPPVEKKSTSCGDQALLLRYWSIAGSFGVGEIAQHLSFEAAFAMSGAILVLASIGWLLAPETRDGPPLEHTPPRPLGPEAAGELP